MDFRAIHVLCMAVSTLMEEMNWVAYGPQQLHVPIITVQKDCDDQDVLLDMMGTLTRMMDTRIHYVTTEGKVIREWIETILHIGQRYRRELELLEDLEKRVKDSLKRVEGT
jgi:hypothetical protein